MKTTIEELVQNGPRDHIHEAFLAPQISVNVAEVIASHRRQERTHELVERSCTPMSCGQVARQFYKDVEHMTNELMDLARSMMTAAGSTEYVPKNLSCPPQQRSFFLARLSDAHLSRCR